MQKETILRADHIKKRFGGLYAVKDVSLEVEKGKILGLIGSNGAGKTTFFNILTGTLKATEGRVCFKGKDITNMSSNRICKMGMARTFQIVKPFTNLTVLENVMVGGLCHTSNVKTAREKAEEIIGWVGLEHRMYVDGEHLNLPERKKVELARALATEPDILLLDEVMAGMGPVQTEEISELVRKINKSGLTIIIIEHVMKVVMSLADSVCVMDQGELIASGAPEEVVNDPAVIKSYLGEMKHVKN